MNQIIRVAVLHGAINNAGDFLIYERGKKLLEHFFDDNISFIYKLRSKPISGDFDGLILLGGPLITRKLHPQSRNIFRYIKAENKNIPCVCIGLGISGGKFNPNTNRDYFLDSESIDFWQRIYKTSKLFSVRDEMTYDILKSYDIKAKLTGCPALFDLRTLERKDTLRKEERKKEKIAVTIPNLSIRPTVSSVRFFLLTLCFLFILKRRLNKKKLGLFFQHGYTNLPNKVIRQLASIVRIEAHDVSGKSLDSFPELFNYNYHIGTRLHSHIYFLSLGRPSFLLSVDKRTEAFLKTIPTPCDNYTINGILDITDVFRRKTKENCRKNFKEFDNAFYGIEKLYMSMKNFLEKTKLFFERSDNENNKNT